MKIFITGASGFVGGAAAKALSGRHALLAMSRSERSDGLIRALGAEPLRSELGAVDPASLAGVEAIIHCAAYVEDWGPAAEYWRINVEGTRQLLAAAQTAGVKRFVHIGTEAAFFSGQALVQADESLPYALDSPFLYSRTKAEAERRVLAANEPGRFETLALRPRLIWGPGDQTILPRFEALVRSGGFVWLDHGRPRTSTTHIANLVHAIELALTQGQGGQGYFITDDEVLSYRDFLTRLLATRGLKPPDNSLPGGLARGLAALLEILWKAARRKQGPPLTRFAAAMLSREVTLKIGKARRELGYEPVMTVEQGMRELKAQGQ